MRKYNNKINSQLKVIKELEAISKDKEILNRWHDETYNNPLKSPMFSKVNTFLR